MESRDVDWSPLPEGDADRFWSKVSKDGPVPGHMSNLGPCWTWTGSRGTGGYGHIIVAGRRTLAHRTPDEQIEIDRASGSMIDYMHWNHRQWRAWAAEVGRRHLDCLLSEEHAAFGVWLAARFA